MATITIETRYMAFAQTEIELPDGYTAADIDDLNIKWADGTIDFEDGTQLDFTENNFPELDSKRPAVVKVFTHGEDGMPEYDSPVFEYEDD